MKYHGATLNFEPKNGSIAALVGLVSRDHSVYVLLEPGDATRYELIITPLWGTAASGINSRLPWKFLLVTRMRENDDDSYSSVMIQNNFMTFDIAPISGSNQYTMDLISYFLMLLYEAAGDSVHSQKAQLDAKYE